MNRACCSRRSRRRPLRFKPQAQPSDFLLLNGTNYINVPDSRVTGFENALVTGDCVTAEPARTAPDRIKLIADRAFAAGERLIMDVESPAIPFDTADGLRTLIAMADLRIRTTPA